MSKIGQKIIIIPKTVTVSIKDQNINIKGNEGEISLNLPKNLRLDRQDDQIKIVRIKEDKKTKSLHGLYRQLINNAIIGVEKMWEKQLEVVGTGYTVKQQGEDLLFKLGYSHPIIFKKKSGIKFKIEGSNKIKVMGIDKQKVGEIAYQIKMLKKPDVYKGKGIKYAGEKLRIKPGKKAKGASAV